MATPRGAKKTEWNEALNAALEICDEEVLAYEKNAQACDDAGNYIGGFGDTQGALTSKYLRERIAQLLK